MKTAKMNLVLLTPGPSSRCHKAKKNEGILTTDYEEDGENLQVGEQATHEAEHTRQRTSERLLLALHQWLPERHHGSPVEGSRRVVLSLDAEVRVQLLYGPRVLLVHFAVASGDT